MSGVQPKDLLDRLAVDEVAGRHVDLRVVRERAGRLRRRRVVGTALSGAGLAACVALAFALATSGVHRLADGPARMSRYGVTWTEEPAPSWTPAPPRPSPSYSDPNADNGLPRLSPSPSPRETPPPGDRPAYVIPASAGLTKAEVPAPLLLWEDIGPTVRRAEVVPGLCPWISVTDEWLGEPIISGREWRWSGPNPLGLPELVHAVAGFSPGTGPARFANLRHKLRPCWDSDRDPQVFTGRAPGSEYVFLVSTIRESDLQGGQYVVGAARVGDVLTLVEAAVRTTRAGAIDLVERLLPATVEHLREAHVPPPQAQWVSPSPLWDGKVHLPTLTVTADGSPPEGGGPSSGGRSPGGPTGSPSP
jgi:hypothetical protein